MRCDKCDLHKTCSSIKIDGRGSQNPKYLFVGQAPGQEEDLGNKVFVGASGQLLLQAIKNYNLLPARLTNTVRCFPPDDRDPKRVEIEKCMPYLLNEIKETKPEIIVAVGNVALKALTEKTGINNYAGRIVGTMNGSKIYAIFHPSYVLRYPQNVGKYENQFEELKRIGEGRKEKEINVSILSPSEAVAEISNIYQDFVTMDFETTGKYKPFGGSIRCMGLHTNGKTFVVQNDGIDFERMMKWFSNDSKIKKCSHNSIFENRWSLDLWGHLIKGLDYDTMLFHYLMDENKAHDLKSIAGEICKASPWDIKSWMEEKGWTWETVPFEPLAQYCGKDAYWTHKIMEDYKETFRDKNLQKVYQEILLPLAKQCSYFEHQGIKIDAAWANKVNRKYAIEMSQLYQQMKKDIPLKEDFNPGSPQQLNKIVFGKLKLKSKVKTDGGNALSVKQEVMETLKHQHPFIKTYLAWKEKDSLINSYLEKFPKMTDQNNLIYPSYNPAFQVTGRISISKPPAGNMPRNPEVRGMVISRFEGGKILVADYKQLEMRLAASESKEDKMIELFNCGKDVHAITAEQMFSKNFTKEERDVAKNINFGTIYGITDFSLSEKFNIKKDIATIWLERHRRMYPNIYKWMEKQYKFVKENGWVISRFGRIRRLPDVKSDKFWVIEANLRQAGNFPIQSSGSDITSMAGCLLRKKLLDYKSIFFHQVHDSILVDLYPGEEKEVRNIISEIMVRTVVPSWLNVSLPIDIKIGERWGKGE